MIETSKISTPVPLTLEVQDWGLIDYEQALVKQLQLLEQVAENPARGFIVFCTHPEIVTLGRKTQADDIAGWSGPVKEIARGGRATYHGPSQLVVYPIVHLDYLPVPRDIGWYLRSFEQAIVNTLAHWNLKAHGKQLAQPITSTVEVKQNLEDTGVWVEGRKVASLGIGVKKWIGYHGAAINLDYSSTAFQGLKPCGFSPSVMISLEELIGQKIDHSYFQKLLKNELQQVWTRSISF